MNEVMIKPPRTVMQVYKMLPEGTLAEVIDNKLYMPPAPTPFHQRISKSLSFTIDKFVNETRVGEVFISPIDLYFDEHSNAVQPDILYVSRDNQLKIDKEGLHGTPDLIIEILSPGNKDHDRITKKSLYEKFRVKEYWIVDHETKLATGYTLRGKSYSLLGEFEGCIQSRLLNETFTF